MRRVAHISDLHFGRHDPLVVESLRDDLDRVDAQVVAVSGDLTQRARRAEFTAAAQFLASLGRPVLVVPGNHDIPLHNLARRLWSPFGRYQRLVQSDLSPTHLDDDLAILGLNTALALVWKGGMVRRGALERLKAWSAQAGSRTRLVVAHHPFSQPGTAEEGGHGHSLVRGWQGAVRAMEACRVDAVLTGHHHVAGHSESQAFAVGGPHRLVIVQAGTATSHRRRGEPNSYNLLHVDAGTLSVEQRRFTEGAFERGHVQAYPRHLHAPGS